MHGVGTNCVGAINFLLRMSVSLYHMTLDTVLCLRKFSTI